MMSANDDNSPDAATVKVDGRGLLQTIFSVCRDRWFLLIGSSIIAGLLALGVTYIVPPIYTASTAFLPPQPPAGAISALASLSNLSGLASGAGRSPVEQYVALLQSTTVANRVIDKFNLIKVYDVDYYVDARRKLTSRLQVSTGRRDGIIYVQVEDSDPARAAGLAQAFVEELGTLSSSLALTEAQQRRRFFEEQVRATRQKLDAAQRILQKTGFGAGAINVEPRAAAEGYARLQAQITASEIRINALRSQLTDAAPEVQQLRAAQSALTQQRERLEARAGSSDDDGYVTAYREFKYQETLLEILARQYETARVDESREGTFIQVIDKASPPERRTWPKRILTTFLASALGLIAGIAAVAGSVIWRRRTQASRFSPQKSQLLEESSAA